MGWSKNLKTIMTDSVYSEIAAKTMDGYNLRCIDGSVHGCSKCVGYCAYQGHPGFLTVADVKKHNCIEKGCFYHYTKPNTDRLRCTKTADVTLMKAAEMATSEMEGLRVVRASQTPDGGWVVYYAAIAQYVLLPVETAVSETIGRRVKMQQIHCDFDVAVSLVMQ